MINGKNIDLRPAPKGAAEMGVNVGKMKPLEFPIFAEYFSFPGYSW